MLELVGGGSVYEERGKPNTLAVNMSTPGFSSPFGRVGRASSVKLRGKKVLFKGRLEGGMWWYHYRETMEEGGRQGARERSDSHDRQTYD